MKTFLFSLLEGAQQLIFHYCNCKFVDLFFWLIFFLLKFFSFCCQFLLSPWEAITNQSFVMASPMKTKDDVLFLSQWELKRQLFGEWRQILVRNSQSFAHHSSASGRWEFKIHCCLFLFPRIQTFVYFMHLIVLVYLMLVVVLQKTNKSWSPIDSANTLLKI